MDKTIRSGPAYQAPVDEIDERSTTLIKYTLHGVWCVSFLVIALRGAYRISEVDGQWHRVGP